MNKPEQQAENQKRAQSIGHDALKHVGDDDPAHAHADGPELAHDHDDNGDDDRGFKAERAE